MQPLTHLIQADMKPALGVTEPGAIAFATATARSHTKGNIRNVHLSLNSGMYKNAFTCGIPHSDQVGNVFAAALGAVAGNAAKGLEALADVTAEDNQLAQSLIDSCRVQVALEGIFSDIFIRAEVATETDVCSVTIRGAHTNICEIVLNGVAIFSGQPEKDADCDEAKADIRQYSLRQMRDYAASVPLGEIDFIQTAYDMNLDLFAEGLHSPRTTFAPTLLLENGGETYSRDGLKTAQLLCNAAIEARVIGLDKPAMSITGSGAHGIICTMPLYAVCKTRGLAREQLLRATALSYLVTMYIKEYSGKLSAFCGCAVAAGTGMACGLVFLEGGSLKQMEHTINNMASSITGMICDGGNQGCVMKGIVAVDAAFRAAGFAMNGVFIEPMHGINGETPEQTMRQMGRIASPGMAATEGVIVEILEEKLAGRSGRVQ